MNGTCQYKNTIINSTDDKDVDECLCCLNCEGVADVMELVEALSRMAPDVGSERKFPVNKDTEEGHSGGLLR